MENGKGWNVTQQKIEPSLIQTRDWQPEKSKQHPFSVHMWQAKAIASLRVAFGVAWAVAAWLKWQPAFQNSFVTQITGAQDGQPPIIQAWIAWWGNLIQMNPLFFARMEASLETALALLLILGLFNNLTCVAGSLLSLGIWSVAEGFGGPYKPGESTDIGTAFPYIILFVLLFVVSAGQFYGLDRWLTPRLGALNWLASGTFWRR